MKPWKKKKKSSNLSLFFRRLFVVLLWRATAGEIDDEFLQVAMHDRCNENDPGCGLPPECCCKPVHNFDIMVGNKTVEENDRMPLTVLCIGSMDTPRKLPEGTETLKLLESEIKLLSRTSFNSSVLTNLTTIYVWKNPKIAVINNFAFDGFQSLRTIMLEDLPALTTIEEHAFFDLPSLRELRIKHTGITKVPLFDGLSSHSLIPLTLVLEGTKITTLPSGSFHSLPSRVKIAQISWNNDLSTIDNYAFNGSSLAQLILNDNKNLTKLLPSAFYGLHQLQKLSLRGTPISSLPTGDLTHLEDIDVRRTPNLHRFPAAKELPSLRSAALTYAYHCCSLTAYGFGSVFGQNINQKHENLRPCNSSRTRWVSQNLPSNGTKENDYSQYVAYDQTYADIDWNNYTIPTYVHPVLTDGEFIDEYQEWDDPEAADYRSSFLHRMYYQLSVDGSSEEDYERSTAPFTETGIGGWREPKGTSPTHGTKIAGTLELCYIDENGNEVRDIYRSPVRCTPQPDAFNPCENVLGSTVLPAISWIVSALAIFGNFFVILVLSMVTCDRTSARQHQHHLSVQKFLVLNLAVADMCMGIYLFMISAMDARSSGQYYKYGVEWQTGVGCKVSGFLSILSSQLSVYTLSVISLERWYAIRFAIQLEKRMTMGCARVCIFFGWLLAGLLAMLPLLGVNNYEKTSICLPFDVSDTAGMAYVGVLLFIAIGAFVVDVICYLWMYTAVRTVGVTEGRKRKSSVSSSKTGAYHGTTATADAIVAKRMAVLVFTNFACFFPISFFALTAAAGRPLISISQSKILLVIFYPINSCCNPFLYAILTKSFRRDLLAWFTLRGYCVQFAAKLNGAYWRRNSVDRGSTDRRETSVRKRLQRCVKYVSKRKSVNLEVAGEPSASYRECEKGSGRKGIKKHLSNNVNPLMPQTGETAKTQKPRTELDNSFSSCNSAANSQLTRKGGKNIFKLGLVTKKSRECRSTVADDTDGRKRDRGIFPEIKWFKGHHRYAAHPATGDCIMASGRPTAEDFSPLMETLDSRNECDFSVHVHDLKCSNYRYGRRASKSRHSTTTIETRLTVGGNSNAKGTEEHEHNNQDVCSSIL